MIRIDSENNEVLYDPNSEVDVEVDVEVFKLYMHLLLIYINTNMSKSYILLYEYRIKYIKLSNRLR